MIQRRKKWCKAGHEAYLFGGGYCFKHQHIRKSKSRSESKSGLIDFYEGIWNSRDRVCEETGEKIGEFKAWNFNHVLPKKDFPEYEYEEENIVMLSLMQHSRWETFAWSDRKKMKIWKKSKRIAAKLLNLLPEDDKRRVKYEGYFDLANATTED